VPVLGHVLAVLDWQKLFDVNAAFVGRGDVPACFAAGVVAGLTGTMAPRYLQSLRSLARPLLEPSKTATFSLRLPVRV
jgi:hypothetical protein